MRVQCVVVYEQTPNNYCAYIPDFPGCVSTGKTWEDIQRNIKEAIDGHVGAMAEFGDPLPERFMTMEEAVAYYNEPLTEEEQAEWDRLTEGERSHPEIPPTFGWIEVEIPSPAAAP